MLKDVISADIGAVFLNFDDFAEDISFDGTEMLAVVEDVSPSQEGNGKERHEGTFRRSLVLYIRALSSMPVIGRRVVLVYHDAQGRWTVREAIEEMGMMRIRLEAVEY